MSWEDEVYGIRIRKDENRMYSRNPYTLVFLSPSGEVVFTSGIMLPNEETARKRAVEFRDRLPHRPPLEDEVEMVDTSKARQAV
jgi:hypothetical protein